MNDPLTANTTLTENDMRNGMRDGQLVMLPPLQINQIIDRGGDDLTFLSDEVLTTESTPSETLEKDRKVDDGDEQITRSCSFIETNSESSTVYSAVVSSINDPSTANTSENDMSNGMGDGQLVMLPQLQINQITDRREDADELTFLSDEAFYTRNSSETLDKDKKSAKQIVVSESHEETNFRIRPNVKNALLHLNL